MAITYRLSEATKSAVEEATGMPYDTLLRSDVGTIHSAIEKKIGKKLTFPKTRDERLDARGSVFVALWRFLDGDVDRQRDRRLNKKWWQR
jgi:hypothetical protein